MVAQPNISGGDMSSSNMKTGYTFVVPCYNEHPDVLKDVVRRLTETLDGVGDLHYEIIVVNDGSQQHTYSEIMQGNIVVIDHERNMGYGSSIITGILHAQYDWIGIVDADGTYPVEHFADFLNYAGKYDLIIGRRAWKDIQFLRRIPKYLLQRLASYVADYQIQDLNSGMCMFRKSLVLNHIKLFPRRFSFTTTLTMVCLLNYYRALFIDIPYFTRKGVSSIHPIADTVRFFSIVFRLALYYKPLRFFMPLSLTIISLAIARGVRDVIISDHIGGLSLILCFVAFQIVFFGLIAEIISKK